MAITGGGTGLTYEPDANYCNNPPGTALDTFTYTLNGGSTLTFVGTNTVNGNVTVANAGSYVALTGSQNVGGAKTFTSTMNVTGGFQVASA